MTIKQLIAHANEWSQRMTADTMTPDREELDGAYAVEQRVKCQVVADLGNSLITGIVQVTGGKTILVPPFPSLVGLRGCSMTKLLRERGTLTLGKGEYAVTMNGAESFVGALAISEAREVVTARGSEDRYADTWNLRFLAAILGAAIIGPKDADGKPLPLKVTIITLTTMLPAELWAEKHAAVKAAMEGTHEFTFNGREFEVRVVKCVVERETFAAWNLMDDAHRQDVTLIIDLGGGTAQAAVIRGGTILKAVTRTQGIETILDDLPVRLSAHEREELKAHLRDNNKREKAKRTPFSVVRAGRDVRVDQDAQKLIDQAAIDFLSQIKSAIPRERREVIRHNRMVGGGTHTAFSAFSTIVPNLQTVKGVEPELANLFGAAKMAGINVSQIVKV